MLTPKHIVCLIKTINGGFNYNFQSGVDDKYGMMAIHYITQSPSDKKELLVTVKELNEILHKENYTIVVNYGYWHIKSLNEIYNSPTTIVIPDKASTSRTKEKKTMKRKKIIKIIKQTKKKNLENINSLNTGKTTHICPNGSILTRQNNNMQNWVEYKVYTTNNCLTCSNHEICASEPKRKIKDRCDHKIDEIKKTYYSEWGQKTYSGRGPNAEGNFGTLRESRNFRGIKTRGIKRVNNELTRYAITHNIKKIHKHMDVKVLKSILNLIKKEKTKNRKIDINILDNLISKFIIK